MTIERTRELLGEKMNSLSDEQVEQLIAQYSQLADLVIDLLKHNTDNATNIVARPRKYE